MRKAKSNPGRKLAALVLSCAAVVSAAVAAPIVYGYQEGLRTPLCKISSTGEIEQRFRLN